MGILFQVVTAAEWAKICNVSPQYIRSLCVKGRLNARKTEEGVWLIARPPINPKEDKPWNTPTRCGK